MTIGKSLTALGGGGLKPEIIVTAKAGALLNFHYKDSSIILQSYQLGADETQHTFVASVSETAYVVEDATNGASVEVLVDAVTQYNVVIEYVLWLYRDGDECENVTGGWVDASSTNGGCFATSNAIDFTNFTKFYATFMRTRSDTYMYRGQFYFGETIIIGRSGDGYGEYITCSADITSITGSNIVKAAVENSNSSVYTATKNSDNLHMYSYQSGYCDAHLYVKEIWLE